MSKENPIVPDEFMVPATEATRDHFDCCSDKWGEEESCWCRNQLPKKYRFIETDWIRKRATALRKSGKLKAKHENKVRKKIADSPKWYLDYLETEHWKTFREYILGFWNYRCCLCRSDKKIEVHHNNYDRIGDEKISDCVALCSKCHRKFHGSMAKKELQQEKNECTLFE